MREIKFRVWDTTYSKMVYWKSLTDSWKHHLGEILAGDWGDRFSIMQFTGLHDKKGKEIYEGDIVVWTNNYTQKKPIRRRVYYGQDFGFCLKVPDEKPNDIYPDGIQYYHGLPLTHADTIEVIGNIYEDRNLLTTEEKQHENTSGSNLDSVNDELQP